MHLVDAGPGDRYLEGRAFWQCSRASNCSGVHGAHPDGTPMGIPGNRETNRARVEAHFARFDISTCKKAERFCREFEARCTPTTSPLVNFFDDPWELAPAGLDPDDLSTVREPAPIDTSAGPSCSPADASFCEQPDGW